MGDVHERLAQQRQRGMCPASRSSSAWRTVAPTLTAESVTVDRGEPGDLVDVDEVGWRREPHVEDRDEALPAGEDLAVVAHLGQVATASSRDRGAWCTNGAGFTD